MNKITILTAAYNCEKTIEQTIASVLEQDYENIEFIIIDGNSQDHTIDVIKKYESNGIRWISEPDEGLYYALNKGIEMATGDYFMVLGADDSLCSNKTISKVVADMTDDVDVLSAAVMVVDEKTGKNNPYYNHHAVDKTKYFGGMIPHQGMFVKTSLGRKYKFDTKYKITADYKFFLQCYYDDKVKFKYIDEPVVFFANSGSSADLETCRSENNRIYEELGLPFRDSIIDSKSKWKKVVKKILYRMGILISIINFKECLKKKFVWEKHHCDNKICRWCGRM